MLDNTTLISQKNFGEPLNSWIDKVTGMDSRE